MIKVIKKRISKKRFIKIDFKDLRKGDIFYSYVGSEDPVKDPNKLTLFTATEDWSFIPGKTARIWARTAPSVEALCITSLPPGPIITMNVKTVTINICFRGY